MKAIKILVDHIDNELCDAKDYAESYVEAKSKGETQNATKYKEMANDELKHSNYVHDMAATAIAELEKVYTAPNEMQEAWNKAHKKYVERYAWVKTMLGM